MSRERIVSIGRSVNKFLDSVVWKSPEARARAEMFYLLCGEVFVMDGDPLDPRQVTVEQGVIEVSKKTVAP